MTARAQNFRQKPALTVIIGPTASGKTELGLSVASMLNGAVISADSRQVYAGMNIGTAKPKDAWRTAIHDPLHADVLQSSALNPVPHYMFNIRHPDEPITLAEWQRNAYRVIDVLLKTNVRPVLVGGAMLYVDSIVRNYNIPEVPADDHYRTLLSAQPTEVLFTELIRKDSHAKTYINSNNKRRIIRALEVIKATGKPFSLQRQTQKALYSFRLIGLFPGWTALRTHIASRADQMLNDGLVQECTLLYQTYGDIPLLNTLNYRQAALLARGSLNRTQARESMVRATMRYAHRQMSWWRKNPDITWFSNPLNAQEYAV